MAPSTALLISTYQRSDALLRCLESVSEQRVMPDRVVIADDGSDNSTRECIERFESILGSQRLKHVWQEDLGFRLARVRNIALRVLRDVDYIIQVDGDMVLHPHFVDDHRSLATRGYYVRGNRMMLDGAQTTAVISNGLAELQGFKFPLSRCTKSTRIVALRNLSRVLHLDVKGVFGGNMSYWMSDAVAINGYNNAFTGWGSEDDDFADRLRMTGVRCTSVRFGAIAYHLDHPPADRSGVEKNAQLRQSARSDSNYRCADGLEEIDS